MLRLWPNPSNYTHTNNDWSNALKFWKSKTVNSKCSFNGSRSLFRRFSLSLGFSTEFYNTNYQNKPTSDLSARGTQPQGDGLIYSSDIDTDLECLGDNYRVALASGGANNFGHIATEIRRNRIENLHSTANDISRGCLLTFESLKFNFFPHLSAGNVSRNNNGRRRWPKCWRPKRREQ